MKQKLLFLTFLFVASIATTNSQNKVWDFGGDPSYTSAEQIAMWPIADFNAGEGLTVEKDGLFLVGDSEGDKFGKIENAGGKTWDEGTSDEYKAINRFKFEGGSNPDENGLNPTHSYLYFPVNGAVDVKIWFRSGSSSANRTLYISDGTTILNSFDAIVDNTDAETITASYTGASGNIYIYVSNSFNLYKIEVTETAAPASSEDVWDFGGDPSYTSAEQIAMWPIADFNAGEGLTVEKDGLFLVGDSEGDKFGKIENAGGKTWDEGTADEYKAINRFKFEGGSNPDENGLNPTHSYLYFPVAGPVDVKIWFRSGSSSANRTLYISDGATILNSFDAIVDNTDAETITASYTGSGGNIYIYVSNSFNLYKIEVKDAVLSLETNTEVKTIVKALGNKIRVSNVDTNTEISIYNITGALVKKIETNKNTEFYMKPGLWLATIKTEKGVKSLKLLTY